MDVELNNLSMAGRVKQFDLRHGGQGIVIGHMIYHSDGARRDIDSAGILLEPPEPREIRDRKTRAWIPDPDSRAPYERAGYIVRYWTARVERAVAKFKDLRYELKQQALHAVNFAAAQTAPQPPSQARLDELKKLRDLVRAERKSLSKAREDMEAAKPRFMRVRETNGVVNVEKAHGVLDQLKNIKV